MTKRATLADDDLRAAAHACDEQLVREWVEFRAAVVATRHIVGDTRVDRVVKATVLRHIGALVRDVHAILRPVARRGPAGIRSGGR